MQLTSQGPEHRYAKALFAQAEEGGNSHLESASKILSVLSSSDELTDVLSNKSVSAENKKKVLQGILSELKVEEVLANFVSFVCDKGRSEYLSGILSWYVHLERQKASVVEATVTSAKELTDAQCKEIKSFVQAQSEGSKDVVLENKVDPSLIAGVKVVVNSQEFDMSVRGRFDGLRTTLKLANN